MLEVSSLWWEVPIWTLASLNVRIVRSEATWQGYAVFKVSNVPNAMALTLLIIIASLYGVVKLMTIWTLPGLKLRGVNLALTHSNILITKDLTLLTWLNAPSGSITSIRSSTPKNTLNSGKPGELQSIQVWMKLNYDFKGIESLFIKHSKE